MNDQRSLADTIKHSPVARSIRRAIVPQLLVVLLLGLLAVIFIPLLDNSVTHSAQPSAFSFVGTSLVISLVTIFAFMVLLRQRFGARRNILYLALTYNLLIIIVKFALAPASLYRANPTLVDGGGGLFGTSNFNGNLVTIAFMGLGVFLMYLIVFTVMKKITINGVSKRIGLQSKKMRAKVNWFFVALIIGFCVFTGAGGLFLLFAWPLLNASGPYLGYVFSTAYSVLIVLALFAAIGCAGAMFIGTERETVLNRNLPILISVIWIGIGLLVIWHILWAVYLFVLTTLWPFKVITVSSK